MLQVDLQPLNLELLRQKFGQRLREQVPLARYTSARLGGAADALYEARSRRELIDAVDFVWYTGAPFAILGGGSNVLISDRGVRGLVILNRARRVRIDEFAEPPAMWAESGANFGLLARKAAQYGLAGLEWAAGIPGSLGGAVVGNAGAHGGDMASNLIMAEILHQQEIGHSETPLLRRSTREHWTVEQMNYTYRNSALKSLPGQAVVLAALLRLSRSTVEQVQALMEIYHNKRRSSQPPGASMGSMFKNPPGDFAGRLIDAAGLKGRRVGDAQISLVHGNFFINLGKAKASDFWTLIDLAQKTVADRFGVQLELEIQLMGEW